MATVASSAKLALPTCALCYIHVYIVHMCLATQTALRQCWLRCTAPIVQQHTTPRSRASTCIAKLFTVPTPPT